jgi:hypothetical protein
MERTPHRGALLRALAHLLDRRRQAHRRATTAWIRRIESPDVRRDLLG